MTTIGLLHAATWLSAYLAVGDVGAWQPGIRSSEQVTPGIQHIHIQSASPDGAQNIHLLLIDLRDSRVRFKAGLAGDTALTRETISAQAQRYGALAAINADFGALTANNDFPQGMTVQDGVLITSPKFRTGLGITADNRVYIGKWMRTQPPAWAWPSTVRAPNGAVHPLTHCNQACEPGWISLYTDRYNSPARSPAHQWADAAEALLDAQGRVTQLASTATGMSIPPGGRVLVGRGSGANWLRQHAQVGQTLTLTLTTEPDWRAYRTVVGGGPRILLNGQYYADPPIVFDGVTDTEDFELSYKTKYYDTRQPRTLAGISADGARLILAVVDGRAPQRAGMTLRESADLLKAFGAHQGLQFDGGGSSCMVLRGEVLNVPSDGSERPVTNSLLLFYD